MFARAQLKTITNEHNWESFRKGVHLDAICKELPEVAEKILARFQAIESNLASLPFAINHGDLTPFNMYPKGVIDFEDSFLGPVGYDLGALIEHLNWFPEDSERYEYYRHYNFLPEQKQTLINMLDNMYLENGLPRLSGFLADLDFAKGVWFVVHLDRTPKLQQFRYSLIKELLSQH